MSSPGPIISFISSTMVKQQTLKLKTISSTEKIPAPVKGRAVLVIHGGAGHLTRDRYDPELQQKYHAALKMALEAGHAILASGGCALDAVEAAIKTMEDSPLFNAGKGAVLTREGKVELEASIMVSDPRAAGKNKCNSTRRTTAVTQIRHVKNPISLAKQLYLAPEETGHVLHAAPYVERLAEKFGCEFVEEPYYHTPARDQQYLSGENADCAGVGDAKGTVGAVALDINGYLAVGTSTGGRAGKLPGRIGDTPVAGAGYWCEQFSVTKTSFWRQVVPFMKSSPKTVGMGISGTGDGDFFLRYSACHDIYERMKLKGQKLDRATTDVLAELGQLGGEGGIIGLTGDGEVIMGMNCAGMFRGWIDLSEGKPRVGIFSDDTVH
jgi:L-asparaginase / beta-aspartyl-peptidase